MRNSIAVKFKFNPAGRRLLVPPGIVAVVRAWFLVVFVSILVAAIPVPNVTQIDPFWYDMRGASGLAFPTWSHRCFSTPYPWLHLLLCLLEYENTMVFCDGM